MDFRDITNDELAEVMKVDEKVREEFSLPSLQKALQKLAEYDQPMCLTGKLSFERRPYDPNDPIQRKLANYFHHGTVNPE